MYILVRVCTLSQSASRAHAPYYIAMCGLPAVPFTPHYLKRSHHFREQTNYWT